MLDNKRLLANPDESVAMMQRRGENAAKHLKNFFQHLHIERRKKREIEERARRINTLDSYISTAKRFGKKDYDGNMRILYEKYNNVIQDILIKVESFSEDKPQFQESSGWSELVSIGFPFSIWLFYDTPSNNNPQKVLLSPESPKNRTEGKIYNDSAESFNEKIFKYNYINLSNYLDQDEKFIFNTFNSEIKYTKEYTYRELLLFDFPGLEVESFIRAMEEQALLESTTIRYQLNEIKKSLNSEDLHAQALDNPNLPDLDVPQGQSEEDNVVFKTFTSKGNEVPNDSPPPKTPIANTKLDHIAVGTKLGGFLKEEAATVSGSRFALLAGPLATLHRALGQWMIAQQIQAGYTEYSVPQIVTWESGVRSGQLPKFKEDLYQVDAGQTDEESSVLIPTSEVPLVNVSANKIYDEIELPLRQVALTQCYRREAGSYGKDNKGLIRLHQFEKVELVQITTPEQSDEAFEQIVADASRILERLELPYRQLELCTGDLGFHAAKTIDLEVWIPNTGGWNEISSISNCRDFQARRAMIRVGSGKQRRYAHTLNGSGVAVGRALAAILENYWEPQAERLRIPEVLLPYMPSSMLQDNCIYPPA